MPKFGSGSVPDPRSRERPRERDLTQPLDINVSNSNTGTTCSSINSVSPHCFDISLLTDSYKAGSPLSLPSIIYLHSPATYSHKTIIRIFSPTSPPEEFPPAMAPHLKLFRQLSRHKTLRNAVQALGTFQAVVLFNFLPLRYYQPESETDWPAVPISLPYW